MDRTLTGKELQRKIALAEAAKARRGDRQGFRHRQPRQPQPRGYHIRYEVIDYRGDMPGDIGIFLSWG